MLSKTKLNLIIISFVIFSSVSLAHCLSADLTGDCFVDLEDFAVMSSQWLTGEPSPPNDMAYIPAGEFEMGDHFNEGDSDEKPVHAVYVDSFCMSSCEITNRQYCDFLNSAYGQGLITVTGGIVHNAGSGTSCRYCDTSAYSSYSQISFSNGVFSVRTKAGRDMSNDPMVCVSWYGAAAYCNWRSQKEGKEICYNLSTWTCDFTKHGYRLPTEAEWEYVARGGLSGKRFPWGDTISHSQANYCSDAYYGYDVSPTRGYHPAYNDGIWPYTAPVGSFSPNGYGLYDMAGNVREWCNDWYKDSYYHSSPYSNPTGSASGRYSVLRGGSWGCPPNFCRVAFRDDIFWPGDRGYDVGFRIVLSVSGSVFAHCPSADLNGDCFVDFEDFAVTASQWLTEGIPTDPCNLVWVSINDPGVSGHEGFTGQMSKYETTNAQYCQFLNAALTSGDISVSGSTVYGASGSNSGWDFVGETYYYLAGSGFTYDGATDGGAARINYSAGVFAVDSGFDSHPVTYVSWFGSTAFCNYYGYRLPTEWEWQAVADYDGSFSYGCGPTINNNIANYIGSTHPHGTTVVGAFGTYGYGMCDMAGNVWEWTSSCYHSGCSLSYRVLRGGCWIHYDYLCTVSNRFHNSPHHTHYSFGFRVCR